MAQAYRVRVTPKSMAAFLRACERAQVDASETLTTTLKNVGQLVARDARGRMLVKHVPSADYRVRVRARSVVVEQTKRKTTGQHPEWGSWQMRHALIPALFAEEPKIEHELRKGIDKLANRFERG